MGTSKHQNEKGTMEIPIILVVVCLGASLANPGSSRNPIWGKASDSCVGRCGTGVNPSYDCQCNLACAQYNDCCSDFIETCNTCEGRCGDYDRQWPCQCNDQCDDYSNCCPDFNSLCDGNSGGGTVTDQDLYDISKALHDADINGSPEVVINLQGQTTSGSQTDRAPEPLFTSVPNVVAIPTVAMLVNLYNNYIADVGANEDRSPTEVAEEEAFLDAVFATNVTKMAHAFLVSKGLFGENIDDLKDYYRTIWFGLYSRQTGYVGSSGFEHVFLGELKGGISGFHSWYRYYSEEVYGNMDYLGYIKAINLGVMTMLEMPMKWNGIYKSISSIIVGGSPEIELALSTICFKIRPNSKCPLQGSNGVKYAWQTYTLQYGGETYVGSAYPTVA